MKIVIAAINTKYIHASLAPWYLLEGVRQICVEKHDITILEANLKQEDENIAKAILSHTPDTVAFSCYIWNICRVRTIAPILKRECPDIKIILGGPEVSHNVCDVMDTLHEADYVISGEGEEPFAVLLDTLEKRAPISEGYGITYRENSLVRVQPMYITHKEPPSPFTEECLRSLKGRIAYLETSRGCPYSCAFCLSGRDDHVRFFGMERVKRDIELLYGCGARIIKLVDRTFNCNADRAYQILEYIIDICSRRVADGLTFHIEVAADLFDERTLALLEKAPHGLLQMEAGIQSFNERTLSAIDRRSNLSALKENLCRIISFGNIHVHTDLIAGLPYEDMDSFAISFAKAFSIQPHQLQLGFLKLLHGAKMRREADKYGYVYSSKPPYEIISSPYLSTDELDTLRMAEDALERLYNSRRFLNTIEYVMSAGKKTALELFIGAGKAAGKCHAISLDAYTAIMLKHFSSVPGVDKGRLRDVMVCDRLSTDSSGRLPDCLKVMDPTLGKLKHAARVKGGRKGTALLYSDGVHAAVVDYDAFDSVDGRWKLEIKNLKNL